ncbi:MAG TPA: alpha/beta fold hydrolase [Planctomycetaceae bacterium]|nr:alpha/beta fold hydrolase [Planctomycetaceae bacterium]
MPRLRINQTELNVTDAGSGPPVLLVHGFPLSHAMWQAQIDALSGRFRVIAPDLRGFGESAPIAAGTAALTMEQFAEDLAALLDALGVSEPVTYCGLSMGGYIGWPFVRRQRARLRALILCDTRAAADSPEARQARRQLAQQVLANGSEAAAAAMLPRLLAERTPGKQPELIEHVRRMIVGTRPETIAAALEGMARRSDAGDLLGRIDLPALVVVGRHDALSPPKEMREIASQIRGSRFIEIPEAGHLAPLENPDAVNSAVSQFLASLA